MNSKQSVIFFIVASFILAIAASDKISLLQETNPILSAIMARTNKLTDRDSQHHLDCFNYYMPMIDNIVKSYRNSHDICIQNWLEGRSQAEAATLNKRENLATSANSTCDYLSLCSGYASAESGFECYKRQGSKNEKTLYNINVNASQHLDDLQEEFRSVEHKANKCTNEAQLVYERDYTKGYAEFNQCLAGDIDVPTPTEAPVPTNSTEKPETTVNGEITEAATAMYEAPAIPEDPIAPESRRAAKNPIRSSVFSLNKKYIKN